MGVFLQSTEATPCGHVLQWKLTPKNPRADTRFMAAMAIVLPWKIAEDFQSFVKNTKLWPSIYKSVSCKKMGIKSSHWSCLKACFKCYTFCFTTFLVRPSTGAQQRHERAQKGKKKTFKWPCKIKVSSTRLKFRLYATLKTCDLQILGNAWKCLIGNLGKKKKRSFSSKKLNFVQSFVECKVSLADVRYWHYWTISSSIYGVSLYFIQRPDSKRKKKMRKEKKNWLNDRLPIRFGSTAARTRFKVLLDISRRVGFTTSSPSTQPTRTAATGPSQGMSETLSAAEAALMAATSGSLTPSTESRLQTSCVSWK